MKQAVLERGVLDLDVVGKIKAPLESPGRDPLIEVLGLLTFSPFAGNRELACLGGYGDILRGKSRQGEVYLERILLS